MFDNNIERMPVVNNDNELIGLVLEKTILERLLKFITNE